MPHFLTRDEIYRVLQRELPDSVYADGAPSGALTTADNYSLAGVVSDAYANLERVYKNKFPQYADEDINDWEFLVFGFLSPVTLSLAERQARLVNYLRTRPKLSVQGMINVVTGAVPETAVSGVDISEWGCSTGGWMLDESELDISTILNGENLVDVTGPGICDADPADYGKTAAEWALMQEEAYTYQVNIYGYTLSPEQRATIDALLTKAEPARSTHVIVDNLNSDGDQIHKYVTFPSTVGFITFGAETFNPDWNEPWTISWWVDLQAGCDVSLANLAGSVGITVILDATSIPLVSIAGGASNAISASIAADLSDAGWKNFVVTYDGSGLASGLKIYLDGVEQALTVLEDDLAGMSTVSSNPFVMHGEAGAWVDELSLARVALSQDQVTEIFNAGLFADLSLISFSGDLNHWYRFSGNADDSIGTDNGVETGPVVYQED